MNTKKQVRQIILSCCLLSAMVSSCGKQTPPSSGSYKTLEVSTSERTVTSVFSASLQGRQDVAIYPQVSGTITQICISEGAEVSKGQTLFIIDQIPYKAALETAAANVASAEAAVATAQMTADSKRELFADSVVSEFEMRTAALSLRREQAALEQAKAQLTDARNNLSYTEVKSPVNGSAGMIPYRIGALVGPSIGTPLVTVSDNDEMYAYFSMTEKQVLALSQNGGTSEVLAKAFPEVELTLGDGSTYPLKGRIDAVSGIIDSKTGKVSMRAVFPNPDHILRSGGQGVVRIPCVHDDCITVPQEATYELQDKVFVYKVVNGKTKSVQIGVSPINDGKEYIVTSGLKAGDIIIAEGAGLLRDGVEVYGK
ncbi:MAG: efflux RND transporter periplasmic adaptor subunit [Prevotella sp.]